MPSFSLSKCLVSMSSLIAVVLSILLEASWKVWSRIAESPEVELRCSRIRGPVTTRHYIRPGPPPVVKWFDLVLALLVAVDLSVGFALVIGVLGVPFL